MNIHKRWILLIASLLLAGCASTAKQAFNVSAYPHIRNIGIANIEYNHRITIFRQNPLYFIIGTSGLLMQQLAVDYKAHTYLQRAGALTVPACEKYMSLQLLSSLSSNGYKVHELHTGFWPAMKKARQHQLPDIDAILRIKLEKIGFRATSVSAAYKPSLYVSVQLFEKNTRQILYRDTIAIGYKKKHSSRITILDDRLPAYSYATLHDLLNHAKESRTGLFLALNQAITHIARDLGELGIQAPTLAESGIKEMM